MTAFAHFAVILSLLQFLAASGKEEPIPVVHTLSGALEGKISYIESKPVSSFLGIPYAAPPVDDLRFQPPTPVKPWNGIKSAKEFGKFCMQAVKLFGGATKMFSFLNAQYSEDCLTLNIYSPSIQGSRPVLVFIHGGAWLMGMSALADGTALAALEDILVVTLNYRLGVLGFLSTNDANAPGNSGLRDQQMALKWIKDNIREFGGDPDRVTLAGESAGAWSTTFHLVSPDSKDLFQSVISFSGSCTLPTAAITDQKKHAVYFAEKFGCDTTSSELLLRCLRSKSAEEIIAAQSPPNAKNTDWRWVATISDCSSLLNYPITLFKEGEFHRVPHLGILDSHEGLALLFLPKPEFLSAPFELKDFDEYLEYFLKSNYPVDRENVRDFARDFYIGTNKNVTDDFLRRRIVDVYGSILMDAPTIQTLRYHSQHAPTYFGVFSYRPSYSFWPEWVQGSSHFDEQVFVWGYFLYDHPISKMLKFNKDDIEVTKLFMKNVANFVKTSYPGSDSISKEWPRFTILDEEYVDIRLSPEVRNGYKREAVNFWSTVMERQIVVKKPRDEL